MTYTNPVWPDYFADPFVLKHAGAYYAYGTGPQTRGREFPLLYSRDLIHWEALGGALTPLPDPEKTSYWAPEVAERNGQFYMYYSAGGSAGEGHRLRLAISDVPTGPFEDTGQILLPDEPFSIDASPFQDPKDGRWYLFFAKDFFDGHRPGTGVAVVALDEAMLPVGGVVPVLQAQADWQVFERNRLWYEKSWEAWHTVEGPFVVFHADRYYCLYSGGRWESEEYGVGYGVADTVLGPYQDEWSASGPSVLRGVAGKVLGPGHNSVVVGPDDRTEYIIYHAWDSERTARRMCIDPLIWTADGPRCAGPTFTPQKMSEQVGEVVEKEGTTMAAIHYAFKSGTTYGQVRTAYEELDGLEGVEPSKDLIFPPGVDNQPIPEGFVDSINVLLGDPAEIAEQVKHIQWIDPTTVEVA